MSLQQQRRNFRQHGPLKVANANYRFDGEAHYSVSDPQRNDARLLSFDRIRSQQDSEVDYHDRGAANHGYSQYPSGCTSDSSDRRAAQGLDDAGERQRAKQVS
jgi:hypothetical protein